MQGKVQWMKFTALSVVLIMMISGFGLLVRNAEAAEKDSDFDGLSDRYEEAIGTDPNNPDTDADGIPDADDPTPKGGMFNTEEKWDTWDIDGYLEKPVVMAGDDFNITFTVSRLMPDGTTVSPTHLEAVLYIYNTRSYSTLKRVDKSEVNIRNGTYSFSHASVDPAQYYFVLAVNASQVTMGAHARSYEFSRLAREMKLGYVRGAAYPEYYTTVASIYPTILKGHRANFFMKRYEYHPSNETHEFLSRYVNSYRPGNVLGVLYLPSGGTAYLHFFKSSLLNKTTVNIPADGLRYNITLISEGTYNLAVTAYDRDIAWDYSYSAKFPFSNAYARVINSTVSWVEIDPASPSVYDNVTIFLHKYSVTTTMNESDFHRWYSDGGLRGIAEEHPEHTSDYRTNMWISLFYYVYDSSAHRQRGYTIFDRMVTLNGHAVTFHEMELPGKYLLAANYHPQQPHHPAGTFPLYQYNGYKVRGHYDELLYFQCRTDVYMNAFNSNNVYFTTTGVNISVTGTKGASAMTGWSMAVYLDGNFEGTSTFTDFSETLDVGKPGKGKHSFTAAVLFSPGTRTIIEALGVDNFPYNWVAHTTFQVKDFLLYVNSPSTMVMGHPGKVSVLAYGPGLEPVEGANVEIHMWGYSAPRVRVAAGITAVDGTSVLNFLHPGQSRYYMEATVSKNGRSEKISSRIWAQNERYSGYIHTNKPVYLPGDTIYASITVYDVDNGRPLAGAIEARLTYGGNGKDVIRENLFLDEFGSAEVEFPVSKDAPWGTYWIYVYQNNNYILQRNVGVRYYETPDTRVVFDDELSLRTGEVEIPVKVEYMFGAPVYQGNVYFSVQGFENRYESPVWDYWGLEGCGRDVDGMWDWGCWWYDPGPIFEMEMNVSVNDGWANATLDIPVGVNRLEIISEFSDDYDHACEASTTYYVGEAPDPDLKTGINVTPSKEPFTALDTPSFLIDTYAYREVEKGTNEIDVEIIDDVSTVLMVNVTSYDAEGNGNTEVLLNVTTDIRGTAVVDLDSLGVDTFNLSDQGRYFFRMTLTVAADNTPPATLEYEFFVHSVVYEVSTSPGIFHPNSTAYINLEARSLVPSIEPDYNYTLTISKRERYFGYYDGYYPTYDGMPVFALSGSANGPLNVSWSLPEYMDSGRYVIRVTFENGQHAMTIEHPVEIIGTRPLEITLAPSREVYFPGDNIDVQFTLSESFSGYVYLDATTGWDTITDSRHINGRSGLFTFNTLDWHHSIDVNIFLIDGEARLISSALTIVYGLGPLEISLAMNRTEYEPGDLAQLEITALTSRGGPAAGAQVSLSIVDAAVFEIFEDYSSKGFYDHLATPYEFEWGYRHYLSWNSDTWYPETLPSSTIAYWPNISPYLDGTDPMDSDYDNDGMAQGGGQGANGAESEAPNDARLNEDLEAELENTDVREWFTDTALWLPAVITDASGKAYVNFTLPDNIGKWRVRGTGRTVGLIGGEEVTSFNVGKDFFIEPKLPYKVTQDDELEFKVLIYNFHDVRINADLGISAGEWIKVFGSNQVTVSVPPLSIAEHVYRVKIFGAMTNNLTLIASDYRGNTDAVRKEMFVTPNGALLATHSTGVAEPVSTEILAFRDELINGTQKCILRLAPGYQGLLKMGFSMLTGYPYHCTEQITSRMIPSILYREYLKKNDQLTRWTDRYLTRKIYVELQSLLAKQHQDGGWGWWQGDNSSLWMSGWVLLGLTIAGEAGFFVDPISLASCQDFLLNAARPDGAWDPGQGDDLDELALSAFLYHSLARSGSLLPRGLETYLDDASQDGTLTPYGMALYGMGAKHLGHPVNGITGPLSGMKTGSHFESDEALGGNVETTAWVLYLTAMENNDKELVRELLEWLNSRRLSTGDWGTTTATVATMLAILEVLTNAQPIDMDITVTVNGIMVAREHVDDSTYRDFYNTLDALDITEYLHTEGENNITVSKQGTGDLFYELTTVEYLRKDVAVNFTSDLAVDRREIFSFEVTADPVNSDDLDVTALNVRLSSSGNLVYLNSTSERPQDPDSPRTFTFNYLAARAGPATISPIIVTYKLTAGQRDSGLITKYYGPVAVQIGEIPTRNGMTRGLLGGTGVTIKMEKSADEFALRPGESAKVALKLSIVGSVEARKALGNLYLRDHPPETLSAKGESSYKSGYIEFPVDTSLEHQEFEYSVEALETYRGDMGTAILMSGDELLAYTSGSAITVTPEDYFIERAFSRSEVEVFSPLTVSIKAWSDTEVKYVAIEDYLVPGSKVDESSLDRILEDNPGTVLSYDFDSEKVTFFISSLGEVDISYKVIPTMAGRLVAPPVIMFPMYSPDDSVQSDSHRLTVDPLGRDWGLKYVVEEIVDDTEPGPDDGDNDTVDPDEDPDAPEDIPVDVNPPDGVGDGDPEPGPVVEDGDIIPGDEDTPDLEEDEDAGEGGDAVGRKGGLRNILTAVLVVGILVALLAAMMVIKQRGKKRGGTVDPVAPPIPDKPPNRKKKVIPKKRATATKKEKDGEAKAVMGEAETPEDVEGK